MQDVHPLITDRSLTKGKEIREFKVGVEMAKVLVVAVTGSSAGLGRAIMRSGVPYSAS
jgi:hypothetical protein